MAAADPPELLSEGADPDRRASGSTLALGFSCIGHAYSHLFTMLYLTIVLVLEREWGLGYAELLRLSTLGALLFGAAALPMGWIGDRWSAVGMMVIYFVTTGAASVLTGLARDPTEMMLGLAAIGLAASIYHPVGIAWLVRNAAARGKALGVNGLFGALGVAGASGVAGVLTDWMSWRAAFILPGIVSIATGAVLVACWRLGLVADRRSDRVPDAPASRQDMWRAFLVLSLTMMCAGMIYQCATTVMPKLLAGRLEGWVEGTSSIGLVVMGMYLCTGLMQIYGGHLADRFPVKTVYIVTSALQVPVLLVAAVIAGPAIVPVLMAALALHVMSIPAEGSLLARYSPSRHRSLAFGAKFVIALGIAPVGIMLAAWIEEATGSFTLLFVSLAGFALTLASAAIFLPGERPIVPVPAPAPAE